MLRSGIRSVFHRMGLTVLRLETLEQERGAHTEVAQELNALRGEVEIRNAEVESIVAHRDQIAANLARQNELFNGVFSELDGERARADELTAEVARLNESIAAGEAEIRDLREQSRVSYRSAERIQEAYIKLLDESQLSWSEAQDAKARELGANARADALRESEQALLGEQARLREELDRAAENEKASQDIVVNLRSELQNALQRQTEIWEELDARKIELEEARARANDLRAELDARDASNAVSQEQVEKLQLELDQMREQLTVRQGELDVKSAEELALQTQLSQLQAQIESLVRDGEARVSGVLNEHEQTLLELSEVRRELNAVKSGLEARGSRKEEDGDVVGAPFKSDQIRNLIVIGPPYSKAEHVGSVIAESLGVPIITACNGWFPNDLLTVSAFPKTGCYVASTHLDASPRNVESLKEVSAAIMLSVPDPREIVARRARAYFEDKSASDRIEASISPSIDNKRFDDLSSLVDWQIENFIPTFAEWLHRWVEYVDERPNWPIFIVAEEKLGDPSVGKQLVGALELSNEIQVQMNQNGETPFSESITREQSDRILNAFAGPLRDRLEWSSET